jgi:hypothetical protein
MEKKQKKHSHNPFAHNTFVAISFSPFHFSPFFLKNNTQTTDAQKLKSISYKENAHQLCFSSKHSITPTSFHFRS